MSKEIIKKIQSAEAEANASRTRATEEAKERIRSAEAEAASLCRRAEAEALSKNAETLRKTRKRADEMMAESRKAAEAEAAVLTESGVPYMGDAVRLIIGGVFEKCQ